MRLQLENTMPSEIRQRKTNNIRFHLDAGSRNKANEEIQQNTNRPIDTENNRWLPEGKEVER